jgi:hypothetical protein
VDVYESNRSSRRHRRDQQLRIPWFHRRMMLQMEISESEIAAAHAEMREIQRQRAQTIGRLRYEKLEIFTQSLFRKVRRAFVGCRRDDPMTLIKSTKRSSIGESTSIDGFPTYSKSTRRYSISGRVSNSAIGTAMTRPMSTRRFTFG